MKSTSLVRAGVLSALMLAGGAYAAEMTLYSGPDFRGSQMTLNGDVRNLERSGFNDRAASIMVRSGRWEVCSDANFAGYCAVLVPGDYRALEGPLFKRVSSAREIGPVAYDERRAYRYGAYERAEPYVDRRYSALEVYTLPGFRGSALKLDRSASALDPATTVEGVSSLIVREGVWELCDNARSCRVYEPGSYPRLGSLEGAPIGSLRRIG